MHNPPVEKSTGKPFSVKVWEVPSRLDEWQLKSRGDVPKLPNSVRSDPDRNKRRWILRPGRTSKEYTSTGSEMSGVSVLPALPQTAHRIHPHEVPFHAEQCGSSVLVRAEEAMRLHKGVGEGWRGIPTNK